jgi:IS30 family transposase
LISSGADVNYIYSSEFTQFTLFETKAYMLVKGNPRHKDLIDFLDDVSRGDVNEQILGICKILREKHIYLDFETMYELVQILKNEYPVLQSKGGKRKTRRQKRRQQRHTKSKHF